MSIMNALHQDISERIQKGEIYDTIVTHIQEDYGVSRDMVENWIMDIQSDIEMQRQQDAIDVFARHL